MVAPNLVPLPDKEPNQRSLNLSDVYLTSYSPIFPRPNQYTSSGWRAFVEAQPLAVVARETLISRMLALDWKIVAREADQQDELKPTIKYYTKLIEKGAYADMDYASHVEWVMKDFLDLPFGGAAEIGRKGDVANGRVAWIRPLDAGTLYPTLNSEFPVVQIFGAYNPVVFPKHAISRVYMSPRTDIIREGWGMAPPEKIFLAMQLVGQGDGYYANLLLDMPISGVLDLADMEKSSAIEWVSAYKDFLDGRARIFKIPVLYEHTQDVKFISFAKNPNEILFTETILKYAAITAAGYGLTLGDLGLPLQSEGRSLAGAIRDQKQTKENGFARSKKKMKFYWDTILPENLQFRYIDYDDELNVAQGRARLANATASAQYIADGVFKPDEMRQQAIADGLYTISVPETLSDAERAKFVRPSGGGIGGSTRPPERPGAIGTKTPSSLGGMGEITKSIVKNRSFSKNLNNTVEVLCAKAFPMLLNFMDSIGEDYRGDFRSSVVSGLSGFGSLFELSILKDSFRSGWVKSSLPNEINNQHFDNALRREIVGHVIHYLSSVLFEDNGIDIEGDESYHNIVNATQLYVSNNFDQIVENVLLSLPNETGES